LTRIATLLPAATEIVAALGAVDELVAISHECDFPPEAMHVPRITTTPIDASQPSARIDDEVRRLHGEGRPVIAVDLARLVAAAPDVIVTQALCEVCAVADGRVMRLAAALPRPPRVATLASRDLEGVLADIRALGALIGRSTTADQVVEEARARLERLRATAPEGTPRVLCVEWTDPPYLAGHWVPDLVRLAGGVDVGARAGGHSRIVPWAAMRALRPDVVLVMLCGFGVARAQQELAALADPDALALLDGTPTWVLDGNAYTSRPGPRLVEAAELIQSALRGEARPGLERRQAGATSP
jgi:iron complex transport system substrate-binding protein